MKTTASILAVALLCSGCISAGGTRSGGEFDYDSTEKLEVGLSKDEVLEILGGEPTSTGFDGSTGLEHWHFKNRKIARSNTRTLLLPLIVVGAILVPGAGAAAAVLPRASASKGKSYTCDVFFVDDHVVDFNYRSTNLGGESVGL